MTDWNAVRAAFERQVGDQLPQVLAALVLLALGVAAAALARWVVRKALALLRVNQRLAPGAGHRADGRLVDVEGVVARVVFWMVLLVALAAALGALEASLAAGPFAALSAQVFDYAPRLLAAAALGLAAWLTATVARGVAQRALARTTLDARLAAHAPMPPVSQSLANAIFWLVILLFLPPLLGALRMDGLLLPLSHMTTKALDMVPNLLAAAVLAAVGWLVALVLRNLTVNVLRSAGADRLGARAAEAGRAEPALQLSRLGGLVVFVVVFVPALIAALDALHIDAISRPATDMLALLLDAVPRIVAAGLILLLSWLVANFAARLLAALLANVGVDALPARIGLAQAFARTPPSVLIGRVALWLCMLLATVEAANQLGFRRFADMISTFIVFAGDVLLGSAILVIGFMLANVAHEAIVRASGQRTLLARVARLAILGIVLAMGLRAMGIADDIVNLAFGLTLGAVAVAVALAFGLGGREAAGRLASRWVDRLSRDAAAEGPAPLSERPPAAPRATPDAFEPNDLP